MPNEIIVHWDEQDGDNIGWAYRTESDSGAVEADDLSSAIEETCRLLGVNLGEGDFAREAVEGGVAHYTAPDCPECGARNALYAEHGHTDGPREYHAACWQTLETATISLLDFHNETPITCLWICGVGCPSGIDYQHDTETDDEEAYCDFAELGELDKLWELEGTIDEDGQWCWDGHGEASDIRGNSILNVKARRAAHAALKM